MTINENDQIIINAVKMVKMMKNSLSWSMTSSPQSRRPSSSASEIVKTSPKVCWRPWNIFLLLKHFHRCPIFSHFNHLDTLMLIMSSILSWLRCRLIFSMLNGMLKMKIWSFVEKRSWLNGHCPEERSKLNMKFNLTSESCLDLALILLTFERYFQPYFWLLQPKLREARLKRKCLFL